MKTIVHADNLDKIDDWRDRKSRIEDGEVYEFHLKNGFTPQLKKKDEKIIDFQQNEYIMAFRECELILYKKLSDGSGLERLSEIEKIMVDN